MSITQKYSNYLVEINGIYHSAQSISVSYPEEGNDRNYLLEEDSYWYAHRGRCLTAFIKQFDEARDFLDIGGGNGVMCEYLQKEGISTILVEPGRVEAQNARTRGIHQVICAYIDHVGFKASSLPSIGLFDLLENIENDAEFLGKLNFYLEDEGMLYLSVPAYQTLFSGIDQCADHFKRYTLGRLKRLLAEKGFTTLYSTYLFSLLPLPIFLIRTLPHWLGKKTSLSYVKKQSHLVHKKRGSSSAIMQRNLNWEFHKVSKGRKILFGSSCMVVAKKTSSHNPGMKR
ncbi:MAG: methyltransferase domain-containing protein [Cytophagia bacterium]|nr:methyltransferase domain-containing protein [Cytophagia bacterium]